MEGFNDAVGELRHAFQTLTYQIVARNAPALRRWALNLAEGLKEGGKYRIMLERLAEAGTFMVKTIVNLTTVLNDWITSKTLAVAGMAALIIAVGKAIKIMIAFRNAIAASGLLIAALTTGIGGVVKILAAMGIAAAGTKAIMMTLNDAGEDHSVVMATLNDNYSVLIDRLDAVKGAMKGVREQTIAQTHAALDLLDVEQERRAAELGRSPAYQKALRDAEETPMELARISRQIRELDDQIADPGWFADTNTLMARRNALATMHAQVSARKKAGEAALAEMKNQIEAEERELAAIRRRIQERINREEAAADVAGAGPEATFRGAHIGRRPGGRDYLVEAMRAADGAPGAEGPDHARAMALQRRFADSNPLVQTSTFEKLRALRNEYAEIRREISGFGAKYAHLQVMADQAFEAAKRHAMGITTVREEMVMLADSVKDRLRSVVGDMVDDFYDGNVKIGDSWRRLMRQIVKDAIWMRARSALSAVGNTVFGGFGSALFPTPGAIPGANPGVALGGPPGVPSFAKGGRHMGGPAWVGEEGPELAWFDGPAQIYDAPTSRRMANRVDVDMRLSGDVSSIADQIRNQIGAAAGPLAQQIMAGVQQQIKNPSDTRDLIRRAAA